jgi:hypothetical protein
MTVAASNLVRYMGGSIMEDDQLLEYTTESYRLKKFKKILTRYVVGLDYES